MKADDARPRSFGMPDWMEAVGAYNMWGGHVSNPSLYATQAARYTRSELVYACINKISEFGAMAPMRVYERGTTEDAILDHPFLSLIARPNPFLSRFQLLEGTLGFLELTGNAYWYLHPEKGTPESIWPLRTDRVKPIPDKEKYISHYEYRVGGKKFPLLADRMVHFKRFHPLKDYEGLSPIEAADYSSSTDIAAQRSNWVLFKNRMQPSGVFESEKERVSKAARAGMERQYLEIHTGDPDKAHKPLFLWDGFKWRDAGMTLRDAEFVNGRKMNRAGVFMVYGVPPSIVLSEDSTRTDSEMGEYMFARYTMDPKLARIAQQIDLSVMPYYGDDEEVRFVDVVPQDRELIARINADYLDRGVITVNEVRKEMGREPVDWGDEPFVPGGMGGLPTFPPDPDAKYYIFPNVRSGGLKQRPMLVAPDEQPIELDTMAYVTPDDIARSKRKWKDFAPPRYRNLLDATLTSE